MVSFYSCKRVKLLAAGLLTGAIVGVAGLSGHLSAADLSAGAAQPRLTAADTAGAPAANADPETLPAALQKACVEQTAFVLATRGKLNQSADGVIIAGQNQILVAWSAIAPAEPVVATATTAEKSAPANPLDNLKPDTLTVYLAGRAGLLQKETAQLTWVDAEHDLALLTCRNLGTRGAKLATADVPARPADLFTAHYETPAPADLSNLAELPPLHAIAGAAHPGAPLFDAAGRWIGLSVQSAKTPTAAPLTGSVLHDLLYGSVKNVTLHPADFNLAAGGHATLVVEFHAGLGVAQKLTATADGINAGRPLPLRYNPREKCYEAALTLAPAPSAIDRPVDEAKLPAATALNFKFNMNHMLAQRSNATADGLYTQQFLNKFFEVTIEGRRRKIYYSALVHATFKPDGTATLLTVDNRTLTGRLESQFSYKVSGMACNWSCGAEQIAYIEVPGAKAVAAQPTLAVTVAGAAAGGEKIAPFTATLR